MQQNTFAITYGSEITLNLSQFIKLYFYSDGFMSNQFQHRSFHCLQGNLFHDFQNAVFRVMPIMNVKWQDSLLEDAQDDFESKSREQNLKKRKHFVQQLQLNLDGELNSNISLNNKLKGTPLTFSSSLFHLVHVASLKFVSLNDSNLEDLLFELVDFPNENTVLKFNPSLNFQKLRTNVVYNGDVVFLAANKLVCNRIVGLYSTYKGRKYEEIQNAKIDDNYESNKSYMNEVKDSVIWASVDQFTSWRVNAYSQHDSNETIEILRVGDVIGLQLSEKGFFLNAFRTYDPFDKVINALNEDEQILKVSINNNTNKELIKQQTNITNPPSQENIHIQVLKFQEIQQGERQQQWTNLLSPLNEQQKWPSASSFDEMEKAQNFKSEIDIQSEVEISFEAQISPQLGSALDEKNDYVQKTTAKVNNGVRGQSSQNQRKKSIFQSEQLYGTHNKMDEIKSLKDLLVADLKLGFEDIVIKSTKKALQEIPYSAYWKIESEQFTQGGPVKWGSSENYPTSQNSYRIRHFQTGRYLEINQENNKSQARLTNKATPNTLFYFEILEKSQDQKYVTKDSFFYFRHAQSGLNISLSKQKVKKNMTQKQLNKLAAMDVTLTVQQNSELSVFKIRKADFEEIWETRFLLYCVPLLMEAINYYGEFERNEVSDVAKIDVRARLRFFNIFERINDMLELLCNFANNKLISNIQLQQEFSTTSKTRQNVIKTENVLPLLFWLLAKSFPHPSDFKALNDVDLKKIQVELIGEGDLIYRIESQFLQSPEQLNIQTLRKLQEHHQKRKVLLNCRLYNTAQELCRNNKINQLCMFRFFHLLEPHIGHHSYVVDSLIDIFSKNEQIIVSLTRSVAISNKKANGQFNLGANSYLLDFDENQKPFLREVVLKVMSFKRQKCPQLLSFWMACCSIDDQAIFSNQDMVFKTLMEDEEVRNYALIDIHSGGDGEIFIQSLDRNGDLINQTLSKFLDLSLQDGNPYYLTQLTYLKKQLNLFASLCSHRNFQACKKFSDIFSVQSLVKYAQNKGYDEDIRAVLFKLIRNIYLEREPFSIQNKPNFVRVQDPVNQHNKHKKKAHHEQLPVSVNQSYIQIFKNDITQNQMFLYDEKIDVHSTSRSDDRDLIEFIQNFKVELLDYLQIQCDMLQLCPAAESIFNLLTLEVIKILQMLLQFGLFNRKHEHVKKKKGIFSTNINSHEDSSKTENHENDSDKLIQYLATLLEYDEQYFKCMKSNNLSRRYEELRKLRKNKFDLGVGDISQLGKGLSSLFTFKSDKSQSQSKAISAAYADRSEDVVTDPLFKKLKSVKKILNKFDTKTFTQREENYADSYEVKIKMQICSVFSYLMDLRQDYLIDNTLSYFIDIFIPKTSKLSLEDLQKHSFDSEFLSLFPENMLASGEEYDPENNYHRETQDSFGSSKTQTPLKQYTVLSPAIGSFDQILKRPFSEVLLLSLYFTKQPDLENCIVDLIQRFACQKKEYCQHLDKLQLLLSLEQHQIYFFCYQMVEKLRNSVQYSQVWLQLNQTQKDALKTSHYFEDTQDRIWKLECVLMKKDQDESVTLEIKQSVIQYIGGYGVIIELIDKAFSVVDAHPAYFRMQESFNQDVHFRITQASKIIKLINTTLNVLGCFAKHNKENQHMVYKRIVKLLLNYSTTNFGQVELICDLFRDNLFLISILKTVEYVYFIDLIKLHGRYAEFLEFYDILLKTSEKESNNSDIHKVVVQHLLDVNNQHALNPFGQSNPITNQSQQRKFYAHEPSREKYLEKFLKIISRCVKMDVGVNFISQMGLLVNMTDILDTLVGDSKIVIFKLTNNEPIEKKSIRKLTSACDILRVVCQNSRNLLDQLFKSSKLFAEVIQLQLQFFMEKESLTMKEIAFLFDSLLPIINLYNETFIMEGTQAIMLSSDREDQEYKQVIYLFAEYFCSHVERIFFLYPKEILEAPGRMNNIQKLAQAFSLDLPKNIFLAPKDKLKKKSKKTEDIEIDMNDGRLQTHQTPLKTPQNHQQLEEVKTSKGFRSLIQRLKQGAAVQQGSEDSVLDIGIMDDDEQQSQKQLYTIYQECWHLFRSRFKDSQAIKQAVDIESQTLSRTLWTISKMFQNEIQGDQKDLILRNEDIIVKILTYLQNWEKIKASKSNVIFILHVLSAILKAASNHDKRYNRQLLYNKLNGVKIILILIWEEQEMEPEYLCTLMKFLIRMIEGGNIVVQKTIYDFFQTSSTCERLFNKFQHIFNMQINSVNSSLQLTKLQMKLVTRSLRILQLVCEGHNLDLQNYLQNQANQKNSYDLVTTTVQLLSSIRISDSTYNIVVQCLETMTEMIQGPCKQNQQAISNSKFLEFAVSVLSEDEKIFGIRQLTRKEKSRIKEGKQANRGTLADQTQPYVLDIHPGRLARIKYNCLNTIISLLECNDSSESFIMRIIHTIPLSVLTNNLRRIFQLFQKYQKGDYNSEVFNRTKQPIIEEGMGAKKPEYYELIIENGFHIYVLMQLFLQNQKAKDLLYQNTEMKDVLNEFSRDRETKQSQMKKNNLFTMISQLLMRFVGSSKKLLSLKQDQSANGQEKARREHEIILKQGNKRLIQKAITFFRMNTCSIDIIRDDNLYLIYFPKLPYCKQLPKDIKIDFHNNVDRTSSKTKLTDLMVQSDQIINIMQHEERLRIFFNFNPVFGFFASNGKLWESGAFYTTVAINILVLSSYSQFFMEIKEEEVGLEAYKEALQHERLYNPRFFLLEHSKDSLEYIIILGTINLAFASLVVFFFLVKKAPLKIQHIWKDFNKIDVGCFKKTFITIFKFFHSFIVLLSDIDILYYTFYIIASIIGITLHPFYFAFHLLDLVRMQQLQTTTQAIWRPRVELGLAFLLLVIIDYYFSIIGYIFFYNDYEDLYLEEAQKRCSSFWECFFVTFDWTFKFIGSVGTRLRDPVSIETDFPEFQNSTAGAEEKLRAVERGYLGVNQNLVGKYYARFIYDNSINIILVFIVLSMILGIIIDTFRLLREALTERLEDQQNSCFICGIDRQKLDKNDDKSKGFDYHIKQEHYMWDYVYYKGYMQFKDSQEYNGNETFVHQKIEIVDTSWFPVKRARGVSDLDEDESSNIEVVQHLSKRIKHISLNITKTQERLITINEQIESEYRNKSQALQSQQV